MMFAKQCGESVTAINTPANTSAFYSVSDKVFCENKTETNSKRRTLPLIVHIRDFLLEKRKMDKHYKKLYCKDYDTEFECFVCCDPYVKLISQNIVTHDFH